MTPAEINDMRARVLAGEFVPPEELARGLRVLRGSRTTASATSTASRKKSTPRTPEEAQAELDDLFGSLGL